MGYIRKKKAQFQTYKADKQRTNMIKLDRALAAEQQKKQMVDKELKLERLKEYNAKNKTNLIRKMTKGLANTINSTSSLGGQSSAVPKEKLENKGISFVSRDSPFK